MGVFASVFSKDVFTFSETTIFLTNKDAFSMTAGTLPSSVFASSSVPFRRAHFSAINAGVIYGRLDPALLFLASNHTPGFLSFCVSRQFSLKYSRM